MLNIKNCFIATICLLLTTIAFGACPCEDAIRGTPPAGGPDSVVSALNNLFGVKKEIPDINVATKEDLTKTSTTDKKINIYLENFYKWYGKDTFKAVDIDTSKTVSDEEFFKKYGQDALKEDCKAVDDAVKTEVQQYIDKSLGKQTGATTDSTSDATKKKDLITQANDYVQNVKNALYPAMLNPFKVFNGDEKSQMPSNQTAEFIASLENSLPAIKNFFFPSEDIIKSSSSSVEITVPAYMNENNEETTSKIFKRNTNEKDDSFKKRYGELKDKVEKNSTYQKYSLNLLSNIAIKSGLIGNIVYALKKREIIPPKQKVSLAEKEKNMAMEGLDPAYYGTKNQPLSIAAVNLKMLHTNNKTLYFMYRILEQLEHANYIQSLKSLQEQQIASMTDDQDINKIISLIDDSQNATTTN